MAIQFQLAKKKQVKAIRQQLSSFSENKYVTSFLGLGLRIGRWARRVTNAKRLCATARCFDIEF